MSEGKVIPVRVAVRARPLIQKETNEGCQICVSFTPDEPQIILGKDKAFTYDYVFNPAESQPFVYQESVFPLIKHIFKGYNATVLAYGQTGSGKTFTMGGCYEASLNEDETEMGIIPRVIRELFNGINERKNSDFTVKVSYLEIHNEDINDLLCPAAKREPLAIREDVNGQIKFLSSEMLNEPTQTEQEIDAAALKKLCDMGFPQNRAKKALLLNSMSVTSAMEWLIQHESDPDIDEPLPGTSTSKEEGAVGGREENSFTTNGHQTTNILQSLREYRRREFKPNHTVLQNLIEMGFDEKDALEALRISRNNQNDACEWLLGEKKTSSQDLDEGLDTNGAVYKAIMANPQVQLGLNNPRCLLAFLQMLDSPLATQQWLSDPDTGPLLVQVSRIYHAEKHAEM